MMKRANVAALALAAGSLTFAAAKPATDPLNALLSAAISAPSDVSYVGVVEVVRMGSHAAEAEVYRVEHRAPNLTRRVYTAPSGLSGDSVVSKGDLAFSIDAKRHRIVETRNGALDDPLALNADYALLLENYRVSRKGSEVFDGRRAIDLVLINKFTRRITMLVRIDEASKLVLDKEEFAPDGSLVSELRFRRSPLRRDYSERRFRVTVGVRPRTRCHIDCVFRKPRSRRERRRLQRTRAALAARWFRAGGGEPRRDARRAHRASALLGRNPHGLAL